MRSNPVDSRTLHRYRFHVTGFEPFHHPIQFRRRRAEITDFPAASILRRCAHPVSLASDIHPSDIRSHQRQTLQLPSSVLTGFTFAFCLHPSLLLSATARVGQILESGLGESYKSLDNVHSPSRSHAERAAYARMQTGP